MNQKKIQAMETQLAENEVFGHFRYIVIDGEIWFAAVDVAKVLGIEKVRNTLANFPDDEKRTLHIMGGHSGKRGGARFLIFINEPEFYRLIFVSRKPEAKKFQDWVYHEVLPSIRKYGKYEMPGSVKEIPMEDFLELVFKENPNADFECTGVTMEERDGRIVPIYHISLTGLNDD